MVAIEASNEGLRERKKRRTRATLVDVAAELCFRQGYDNTTVEQIAAAADLSPRTFSRYFPTKDAVIAAVAEDVDEYVAAELVGQPFDITEHEALVRAHVVALGPDGPSYPVAFNRIAVLIQIVNSSQTLSTSPMLVKQSMTKSATTLVIAARMGLEWDDPAVKLVADTWTALYAASIVGLGLPGNDPIDAEVLCERLWQTYEVFTRLRSPWKEGEQEGDQPGGHVGGHAAEQPDW